MSDATPPQVALAKLRELLAQKVIDQSTFELLSAPHRADNLRPGTIPARAGEPCGLSGC